MSDALCGPSSAVQNLTKHSSVDRTLQQDRLISRHSPAQAFRSQNPTAASLDSEFDAFQAGPGPAFAAHSFAGPSFSNSPSHTSFQPNSPNHPAEWTRSFQGLDISSPPIQHQHQHPPQAWHGHFNQNVQSPTVSHSNPPPMQIPETRFHSPMVFRGMQNGLHNQQHAFHQQQAPQVRQDLHQDQFDESAFEAAFDAAMADVSTDHQAQSVQESFKIDIYPHLPLFRVVLANAIVSNTDESLHKAAKVVDLLSLHDDIDPMQATLFRPLLTALNDPKRTLFASRYGLGSNLDAMNQEYSRLLNHHRLELDPTTEQLLASYADVIWQRSDSNHLQPSSQPRSAANAYWFDQMYEGKSNDQGTITDQSVRLLTEELGGQILSQSPQARRLDRVLELEANAYSMKSIFSKHPITESALPQDPQAKLFLMLGAALNAPETVEALDQLRVLEDKDEAISQHITADKPPSTIQHSTAYQDHYSQLMFLEHQNKRRLQQWEQNTLHDMASPGQAKAESLTTKTTFDSDDDHDLLEEQTQVQDQMQAQEQTHNPEQDEELARTAAELLDRVSDNRTSKFKNSAFLCLMRQLADREVRVEGDKMVPIGESSTSVGSGLDQMRAPMSATSNTQASLNPPQDGDDVVNLLNQPDSIMAQDSNFMMTSPFAFTTDY